MAKIIDVTFGSLAKKAGIKVGEELIEINKQPFKDILDYTFAEGQDECTLTIKNKNGQTRDVKIVKKDFEEYLGLEFDDSVEINDPIRCHNNCKFCFVDQLPKGLRDTLYVKDDDYRLSFSCGCYVTCTNLKEEDIQRIINYKLSPLYVSVHATDEATRLNLLGIKRATPIMDILKRFVDAGIKINTQIVLCPDYNDKEILKKSLEDIFSLGENILSLAVVPVGLTEHRDGLTDLRLITKEEANATIDMVEEFYKKRPYFCYCSDEMYLKADREIPSYDYYGDFDQIENGVGLIAKLLYEVDEALEYAPKKLAKKIAFITGVSGKHTMDIIAKKMKEKWKKCDFSTISIVNNFFGKTVTVAGLVTATDIIDQTKDMDFSSFDEVIIPSVMLKEFDTVFLDGVTITELEEALKHKILVSAVDGECLVDTVVFGE